MQSFLSKIFSANPGEPHRPLSMTASGGELCSNQIAAFADRHFFVKKEIRDKRTVTRVKVLEGNERIDEIARMLGGGKAAIEHAREMVMLKGN